MDDAGEGVGDRLHHPFLVHVAVVAFGNVDVHHAMDGPTADQRDTVVTVGVHSVVCNFVSLVYAVGEDDLPAIGRPATQALAEGDFRTGLEKLVREVFLRLQHQFPPFVVADEDRAHGLVAQRGAAQNGIQAFLQDHVQGHRLEGPLQDRTDGLPQDRGDDLLVLEFLRQFLVGERQGLVRLLAVDDAGKGVGDGRHHAFLVGVALVAFGHVEVHHPVHNAVADDGNAVVAVGLDAVVGGVVPVVDAVGEDHLAAVRRLAAQAVAEGNSRAMVQQVRVKSPLHRHHQLAGLVVGDEDGTLGLIAEAGTFQEGVQAFLQDFLQRNRTDRLPQDRGDDPLVLEQVVGFTPRPVDVLDQDRKQVVDRRDDDQQAQRCDDPVEFLVQPVHHGHGLFHRHEKRQHVHRHQIGRIEQGDRRHADEKQADPPCQIQPLENGPVLEQDPQAEQRGADDGHVDDAHGGDRFRKHSAALRAWRSDSPGDASRPIGEQAVDLLYCFYPTPNRAGGCKAGKVNSMISGSYIAFRSDCTF